MSTVATDDDGDWIGVEIAEGRYKVLGRIGQGSMGSVYLAYDRHLETDVVLKVPGGRDAGAVGPEFLDRFAREIRSLVRLSHPHIVKVIDACELDGHPFVVMQFLAGGSLKDRMMSGPDGEFRPLPASALRGWLLEIAKALDFVHAQQHIHRDVKPANILFDRHDNAFLGDFGIIKALASDEGGEWQGSSLTAPGFLLGTPNYVAPEIVMGRAFDGRVDQYALAMTVHEVLCGRNCMEGPTPSATVVNQTMVVPPALEELIPGMPRRLSDAVLRGLAKDPDERFESCAAMAREILAALPADDSATATTARVERTSRGSPGRVPCPACGAAMPVGREHAGSRIRCVGCQAISAVSLLSSNTVVLKLVRPAEAIESASGGGPEHAYVVDAPDDEAEPDPSAVTAPVARPAVAAVTGTTAPPVRKPGRGLRAAALLACGGLALVLILGAVFFRDRSGRVRLDRGDSGAIGPVAREVGQTTPTPQDGRVEINIAYGTEKQQWFEAAAAEFQKSDAGRGISIVLHGMGSMEGARAVLDGPEPIPMHVWSPASSAYRDTFEREWRTKHARSPIVKAENLVLTPLVFVMWEGRHEAFIKKYAKVRFRTVAEAMLEPGGWGTIAGRPEWGRFKFTHTHPEHSNSGLLTLVLMAYGFFEKDYNLSHDEVARPEFREWLKRFERGVVRPGGSLTHSTGSLMRELVLRGPSQYDCVFVYENLAIGYLDAARDRWGPLVVDYPEPNMWNEHPYYILDVPWSDSRQREAAGAFLRFLMREPIQRRALEHGFRPGNTSVSVRGADSPLVRHAGQGLRIELPRMCDPPTNEVVRELLEASRRVEEPSGE
jgi:eukaryotic-like serine/threonine-protein kinase